MPSFSNPIDNYRITDGFGVPRPGRTHQGIDLVPTSGTPLGYDVRASRGGTATVKPLNGAAGNMVTIDHGDGFSTTYMHLNDFTITNGQVVQQGQLIGHVGNTGTSSGPHLHYEVRKDGVPQNPSDYLSGRSGPPTFSTTVYGSPGSSASPGGTGSSSADQKSTIEVRDQSVVPNQQVERRLDLDESEEDWDRPTDPHEPYYAAAEVKINGVIICPLRPLPPLNIQTDLGDVEVPGVDLRLEEFQFRFSYMGGSIALIRLFVKAWTDVVQTMELCSMQSPVEFRYGYTNVPNGLAGPFYGYVTSVSPQFLQNGYTLSIEVHDTGMVEQNLAGAKRKTWRVDTNGRISDIVKVIADQNGWATCIEPTVPVDPEKNPFVQKDMTDFTFIKNILAKNARSDVPRSWIKSDGGRGYGPYQCYLKYHPRLGQNVLHFHPHLPPDGSLASQAIRTYKWGGVMDAANREIGTVIDFKPNFQNQAFHILGGSTMKGISVDPFRKKVSIATAAGSDVQDSILPENQQMLAKMSASRRTRAEAMGHRDSDILKTAIAQRHFALRDLAFDASLTVVGDPFMSAGQMINVRVLRPNDGVMMFYDWWITEAIHTIVGGEFTTTMTLIRMATQNGARPGDLLEPGLGVGMLNQQSSVGLQTKDLVVGSNFDPDGVQ